MKKSKKILILLLILSFVFPCAKDTYARKLKRLKLSKKNVSMVVGKTKKVKIKSKVKKVKLVVKKNKVVKARVKGKKIILKAKKAGTTKIIIKGYKNSKLISKATLKVKVVANNNSSANSNNTSNNNSSTDKSGTNSGEYALNKTHNGYATYYVRESTGCANLDDYEDKYYTCAMNKEDYLNGLAGAYIEVTDKDGDKINVLVTDMLPEGKKGDIDLSKKAFKKIEPLVTGKMKISWKVIPFETDEPVCFRWKETSSRYWAEVQIRNHKYPIKSVEYYDKSSGSYKKLERQEYNYFTADSGMGSDGPYTFRIKDIYGHTIIEKNIPMNNNNQIIKGSKNF